MAFIERRLLDRIGFGYTGGPGFQTDVVAVRSGYESRNANWIASRHRFEVGLVPRPKSQFEVIKEAFMICHGRHIGFRFKDAHDFECVVADGILIPLTDGEQVGVGGLGYGVPDYQLAKVYAIGSDQHVREITKPVTGTVQVYQAASPVSPTVDTTDGIITFTASQTRVISTHTPGAAHIIDLASAFSPNLAIGQRVYISGVTGTAADVLNNMSHAITNVASDVITIATSTSGLTATGGNADYFPQADDPLTWSGEFDVPVRFDVDQFDAVIVNRNLNAGLLIELPSVPLVETRDIA